ncbi:MAG: 3D domain-containing protein [Gaiellaceae bacterium]
MPGEKRTLRAWPALAALLVVSGLLPAKVAADSSAPLRSRAAHLSKQNADLAVRSHSAVLDLYALDSRLTRARARVGALRIQTAQVRAARAAAQRRLAVARRSLAAGERALSVRLQQLYEQGDGDPVALVLGAGSVDAALSSLDTLNRLADQDRRVVEQTRRARMQYQSASKALASRVRQLEALSADASQTAFSLERARAQRASYLGSLAAQRRLNAASISMLEQRAQAVETRARQLATLAAARGRGGSSVVQGTLTVTATGYSLGGHTATGAPAGWGVVAVDPSVIPLGTRMTIPGYGEGIAADTGSAVVGATIDLWFPTLARARAWGRRTVTITLH